MTLNTVDKLKMDAIKISDSVISKTKKKHSHSPKYKHMNNIYFVNIISIDGLTRVLWPFCKSVPSLG